MAKSLLLTYCFNTFVFLHIFNMVNCRKTGIEDKNVTERIFHNKYFLIVFIGMIIAQYCLVNYGHWFMFTTPLTNNEFFGCAFPGASVFLVSFILKLTPKSWVDKIPDLPLDEENTEKNKYVAGYESIAGGKLDVSKF